MLQDRIPPEMKDVIISQNPGSGSSDKGALVQRLAEQLQRLALTPRIMTNIDQVIELAETQIQQGVLRAVVAAGGDGTVSLLANRLPANTPLAIFPLGTENLLAKYLKVTSDPVLVARMIHAGATAQFDAGRANGKLFLVMASCGFDAEVVQRLHSTRTGHIQHWSYAKPIAAAIGHYRYPQISMWIDEQTKPVRGKWAFIFNVPRYAMNLPIVPDADSQDGFLNLCTFRGGNLFRGLFYLGAVLLNQHRRWRASHLCRFKRIRLESDEPVPYQLDGDPGGVLPLEIVVQPGYLRLIVPSGAD